MTDANTEEDSPQPHVAIRRISHELRTPLTVVIGFCELLQDERPDDENVKEFASRISANAWMLHTAVERLIKELHHADYTGPPTTDQVQFDHSPGWSSPDSLFSTKAQPNNGRANQIDDHMVTDEAQPAE